ncbi:hypothetical protein DENSPDRAFT_363852 [Dentipellis sp. KUC8613]|nr:hypothetical protein DENSPDRAFT_363852 [Dentipellis sp. KUC8613]
MRSSKRFRALVLITEKARLISRGRPLSTSSAYARVAACEVSRREPPNFSRDRSVQPMRRRAKENHSWTALTVQSQASEREANSADDGYGSWTFCKSQRVAGAWEEMGMQRSRCTRVDDGGDGGGGVGLENDVAVTSSDSMQSKWFWYVSNTALVAEPQWRRDSALQMSREATI